MIKSRIRAIEKKLHHQKRNILLILPEIPGRDQYNLNGKPCSKKQADKILAEPEYNDIIEVICHDKPAER